MKQFELYSNSQGLFKAVKQGWSWPAFIFGILWAITKRLWSLVINVVFIYLVLGIVSIFIGGVLVEIIGNIVALGVFVVFGAKGNVWWEMNLQSKGYEFKDSVTAANSKDAIAQYLKSVSGNQSR